MDQSNYQEVPGASQSQERLNNLEENNLTTTADEVGQQRERIMFEKYVQDGGETIPDNFKNAGDWFDSLKEAQKNYTQGQQEMAALKNQYQEGGVANPNYREEAPAVVPEETPTAVPEEAPAVPKEYSQEELRLQPNREPEPELEAPKESGITGEQWQKWSQELAIAGELSDQTREVIKQTTGFPDTIIDGFVDGQKAQMREAYDGAANLIGGRDKLDKIFKWAESSLTLEEQATINLGLSSPSYEVTLRGLESMYASRSVEADKAQEPSPNANTGQVAATDTGFVSYKTKREFAADRNNPRFNLEPQFRQAVEQRMLRTDFNSLPA